MDEAEPVIIGRLFENSYRVHDHAHGKRHRVLLHNAREDGVHGSPLQVGVVHLPAKPILGALRMEVAPGPRVILPDVHHVSTLRRKDGDYAYRSDQPLRGHAIPGLSMPLSILYRLDVSVAIPRAHVVVVADASPHGFWRVLRTPQLPVDNHKGDLWVASGPGLLLVDKVHLVEPKVTVGPTRAV